MPYVLVENGRYIGEHTCGKYHYGDMTIVRPCCVEDARTWKEIAMRVALTTEHPAFRMFLAAWNSLTDAEMELVGWWQPPA